MRRVRTKDWERVVRRSEEYHFILAMLDASHFGAVIEATRTAAGEAGSGQIMVSDPKVEVETA